MTIKLFPHQERGAAFLASSAGTRGLFFGMGTGKTLTAIYGWLRSDCNRAIVVGPPISMPMWLDELNAHTSAHVRVQWLKTGSTKLDPDARVLVVSYAIAAAAAQLETLKSWARSDMTALIIDESHALKSYKAKRTRAILGRGGLSSTCARTWMLTGTPMTRWNDDLYPFLCRADLNGMRERCGGDSPERFQLRYTVRQQRTFPGARYPVKLVVGNSRSDELSRWLYGGEDPLALRVDLESVFRDMPPITHRRYIVPLDYKALTEDEASLLLDAESMSVSDIEQAMRSAAKSLSGARRALGLGKVGPVAAEIAEKLDSGMTVLVGAWHTSVIDLLAAALRRLKVGGRPARIEIIDGRTSSDRRREIEVAWNAGELDGIVGQISAMGVSLNLQQGGSYIAVIEEDWSPAIMDQFYARLWRFGQKRHVHVDTYASDTKLDAALHRISRSKAREHARSNEIGNAIQEDVS